MWIQVQNLHAKLINGTDDERAWLGELLSFEERKAFKVGGRMQFQVHKVQLFNVMSDTFPAGFLPEVYRLATARGWKVEVADQRVLPCVPDPTADLSWLRPYQLEAVDAVVRRNRGVLKLATGAGKGDCAVGVAKLLPCRWAFLTHRNQLAQQQAERWERLAGLPAGYIGEGEWKVPDDARFVCASLQSLYRGILAGDPRARALAESCGGLFAEEAHVFGAETFAMVTYAFKNAYYRVALSATPFDRTDKRTRIVIGALGPIIYELPADTLIQAGTLARPRIRMVEVRQESTKPTWQGVYGECVVRSAARNAALVACAKRAEKPALLFVKELAHGRELVKRLSKAKISAEFVWGNHSTQWRKDAVKRLISGHLDVLVCSVVFQEGIDIPELRSVVIGSGGRSVIASLQRVGRGMRMSAGKKDFEVYDVKDIGQKSLEAHAVRRMQAFAREKYEVVVEPEGTLAMFGGGS